MLSSVISYRFFYGLISLLFMLSLSPMGFANSAMPKESQLQAIFLFRFSLFVTWPDSAFAAKDSDFIICILGQNPFEDVLDLAVQDEKYNGRTIKVSYLNRPDTVKSCHILFISPSEAPRIDAIIRQTANLPILTVGNVTDFIRVGGMIEFYLRDNRVRFMIDPQTIRDMQLTVSANLLRVGDVVQQ
ncbi:YfiR family protein [Thioflexithrix psekupsensis]|uniref:DUF4154 domain-containing protein n=1 Tax=Thioflexithrix psekupsensis TaxID=1570016 RepID=A0A251X567_9GAMM|nr:YfiR family protein [Thioflexithrix psekupsensis]OUD12349.1 hypothetical protein TPSD3_14655 [Thioflexithrix psekupsensis]